MDVKRPLKIKQLVKMGKCLVARDEDGVLWVAMFFETQLSNYDPKKPFVRGTLRPLDWDRLTPPEKIL